MEGNKGSGLSRVVKAKLTLSTRRKKIKTKGTSTAEKPTTSKTFKMGKPNRKPMLEVKTKLRKGPNQHWGFWCHLSQAVPLWTSCFFSPGLSFLCCTMR